MRRILSVFLLLFICLHTVAYADGTSLGITYTHNDTDYSVNISISSGNNICAGTFEIVYDSASFQMSGLTQGSVIENAISVVNSSYTENSAKVTFMSVTPIAADGDIVSFNMSPKSENAYTKIEIKNLLLADEKENPVECNVSEIGLGKKPEQSEKLPQTPDEPSSDIHINTGSSGTSNKTTKKAERAAEQRKTDVICLQIDNNNAVAYGKKKAIDENNELVVPYISHDRTLVPLRFVAETLGADVIWENGWNGCIVKKGDKEIKITFGSAEFAVNGKSVIYDAPIEVVEERTMVPIRFISEEFDCDVYWEKDNRAVVVCPLNNPWIETATAEKTALLEMLELINVKK